MFVLELSADSELKCARPAGAKESAGGAHWGIEVALDRLCGFTMLCRLVGTDGDVAACIICIA